MCLLLVVSDSATLWTVAYQAPLSMGFPRQEYWSGLPFPPPGDLPDPGIEPVSLASSALAGGVLTTEPPGKPGLPIIPAYKHYRQIEVYYVSVTNFNLLEIHSVNKTVSTASSRHQ